MITFDFKSDMCKILLKVLKIIPYIYFKNTGHKVSNLRSV